jgi:transglutaminase-like putative cysteine protease
MLYEARHTTRYLYEDPVSQCWSEARITPRELPTQTVRATRVEIHPEPAIYEERIDYFGNQVSSFAIFRSHTRFITTATSVIEVLPRNEQKTSTMSWEKARDHVAAQSSPEDLSAFEFVFDSPFAVGVRELAEYAKPTFTPGRPLLDAAQELSHRIHTEFTYLPKSTTIEMPLLEILQNRAGVCQDFSHIMIGALRSLRIPARYVSGYLRSGAKYQGAEASHAWVSVFIPDLGWVDFDPTNDLIPAEGHVTLAWGRDFGDVTPIKGIALGGGEQTVEVEVRVDPLPSETPSKPGDLRAAEA